MVTWTYANVNRKEWNETERRKEKKRKIPHRKGSVVLFKNILPWLSYHLTVWSAYGIACADVRIDMGSMWMVFCVVCLTSEFREYFTEFDWHFLWYALTGGWMKCWGCHAIRLNRSLFFGYCCHSCLCASIDYLIIIYCKRFIPHHFANHWNWNRQNMMRFGASANGSPSQESLDTDSPWNTIHCSVKWKYLLVFENVAATVRSRFGMISLM